MSDDVPATPSTARPNPYIGPRAFERGETLYGRDREVLDLLDLLIAERVVLLYSPSGAGKTSLIQAALIPELEREGFRVLPVMRVGLEPPPSHVSPANRYVLSLLLSLEETLAGDEQMPLDELAGLGLRDYVDHRFAAKDEAGGLVLIFDQFEEILTVDPTDRAAKAEFFEQVGQALRNRRRWALFAMREEFVAGLDPYLLALPTHLSSTYRLELLGARAATEAIQKPARDRGVQFQAAAATRLVDDLRRVRVQRPDGSAEERPGPFVEPVQLQVVCRRLWDGLPPGADQVVEADLEAVGDVDSALAGYYADQVTAVVAETGVHERAIRDWFDSQLITEQGIRGQVLQGPQKSGGLDNEAIWPLVDAHLVRAELRHGATWFELAHDRLVEPVRADNRAWFQVHSSPLVLAARAWNVSGKDPEKLYRGNQLQEAVERLEGDPDAFSDLEEEFIHASAHEERTQSARRLRLLLAAATVLLLVFSGLSAWAVVSAVDARDQRETAVAALALAEFRLTSESGLRAELEVRVTQEQLTAEVDQAARQATRQAETEATASALEAMVTALAESPIGSPQPEPDTDGDGLTDAEEIFYGTDPDTADSDGDGLSDGAEVQHGTNPLNPDSDGDGVQDDVDPDPARPASPTPPGPTAEGTPTPTGTATPTGTPTATASPTRAPTARPTRAPTPDRTATAFVATEIARATATGRAIATELARVYATQTAEARCPTHPEGELAGIWEQPEYGGRLGCPVLVSPVDGYWAEQPFENGQMYWMQLYDWFFVMIGQDRGTWQMIAQSEISWPWNPGTSCEPDESPGPGLIQPIRGFGGVWCFLDDVQARIGFATAAEIGVSGGLLHEFEDGFILRDSRGYVYIMLRDGDANTGPFFRQRSR